MTVEETIGSLKAHEERLKGSTENTSNQLLLTEAEWKKRETGDEKLLMTKEEWAKKYGKGGMETSRSQGSGNYYNRDGGRRGRDRRTLRCFNCGIVGHFERECRRPRRDRENKDRDTSKQEANLTFSQDDEPALLFTECTKEESKQLLLNEKNVMPRLSQSGDQTTESNVWYLDNGASQHMTGYRTKFRDLNEGVTGKVKFGDWSTVDIKGKGSVVFKTKDGTEKLFHDVYYIPELQNNIISLGQLSESGNEVVMKGEYMWIYDDQRRLLMKVKRSGNRLYKILLETAHSACLMSRAEESTWLWHTRFGHVNFQAMALMSSKRMAEGLPDLIQPKKVCVGCLMAKQTRTSFPRQTEFRAKKRLELIHGDLCGPISPPTAGENRYFLLLVDDFSRVMWTYMLKSKDEAFGAFKKFKTFVEKESGDKIKTFRTDRGGEFMSKNFVEFCHEAGITRHFTAPYSPQQNGVVERRNRTVVAMTRSFLKEMNLPSNLWGEAVRHSVYILNRLPTRSLSNMTPYEAWSGDKPNVAHIRVFGCVAHMKFPSVHTAKLDDRSKIVVNLGKEEGTKAYHLLDPVHGTIHVSRDVIFEEGKAWQWTTQGTDLESPAINIRVSKPHMMNSPGDNTNEEEIVSPQYNENNDVQTPVSSAISGQSHATEDLTSDESAPRKFRSLNDVYADSEEVFLDEDMLLLGMEEPANYKQALTDPAWTAAMKTEIEAIEHNNTWNLVELPPGHTPVGLKWVYKLKKDTSGNIIKHKARLVAKGYVQKQGVDYDEVFAPVTRLETVRLLLALAARNEWEVHHLDVKSAFLNGELQELVFVSQPPGFEVKNKEHLVYQLVKALYGLHQAPRAWYARLSKYLKKLGFCRCPYEQAVYTKKEGSAVLIIRVYVDDLLVTGTSVSSIQRFKRQMGEEFDMTDLGKLSHYLGMEVNKKQGYIELKQESYAKKLLVRAGMAECRPTKYPMETSIQLDKDEKGTAVDTTQFKSIVGGLRYLVHTRPDIAYAVGVVSRYMERPTVLHQAAVKRILRYIKGMTNYGLIY